MQQQLINNSLKLSSFNDVYNAMNITRDFACSVGFTNEQILYLVLVTEEACTNSLKHGDTNVPPTIHWRLNENDFEMRIIQYGSNDFEIAPKNELNDSKSGRGLQIILFLMDEVKLEKNENSICLVLRKFYNPKNDSE